MQTALLLGSDHTQLGAIATATAGRTAAALSRGRFPKGYPHVDPNEDAVAVADLDDVVLLAVADGHDAAAAAETAIRAVAETAEEIDAADPAALGQLTEAVCARIRSDLSPDSPSSTALTIVLVDGSNAQCVTFGDTVALRLRGRRGRRISQPARFLTAAAATPDDGRFTASPLRDGDRIVVASDGLIDFLGRRAIARLGRIDAPTDESWVVAAVQAAFAGGAGDNVAVASTTV